MDRTRSGVRRGLAILALTIVVAGVSACSGAGTTGSDGTDDVVAVTAVDYAFQPSSISVPAGKVTFRVTNAGSQEHEFEILKGDTAVDELEGLVPGLTLELTADLAPGTYTYVCKLADHEQRGMRGTLTVEP
jgi:iron uptake system component EfeO